EGNVKALARYWLSKSLEAEESATLLFDHQQWSACISRLYYASFYAMSALLALRQLSYGKHSAVRSSLHRDFVKTGLLPVDVGMVYNRLFEWRQKADYEAFLEMDEQMADDLLGQARDLLKVLRTYAETEMG
ncbi:MAG TPA: HEPN domain-containing protein, partial [Negativicutes bacterium]